MKAQLSKIGSLFTLNNLVSVLFVAWIGNAVKTLYEMSKVPVAEPNLPTQGLVRSHMSPGSSFDLRFYLSTEPTTNISNSLYLGNMTNAIYADDFQEGSVKSSSEEEGKLSLKQLALPRSYCNNGTLFLQAVAVSGGKPVNFRVYPFSQHLIPIEERDSKHYLLDGGFNESNVVHPFTSIPSVIEVGVILETREMVMNELLMKGLGRYINRRSNTIQLPLHVNPFVTPRDEYLSLATCPKIDLTVVYKPVGMSYWLLSETLIRSFDNLEQQMSVNEYDIDSFKMLITGSSITKLAVVYLVSLLHFVFEYLSIKSDLSFWRSKTRFDGISESSIGMNIVLGGISALYVVEQGESKIALYFILIKIAMNLWKIYKLRRQDSGETSQEIQEIHKDEARCMRYLMVALVPLVLAFCVYRLIHYKFRSWYSWAILSVTAASEVFGFVTMTPQIFMNYRLKSVEHLPWTALTYSFINTFIDDLFAFGIFRVPEVSRYSCLRDDIVFVIVCIQRWYYKKRRVDDADVSEADTKEIAEERKAVTPTATDEDDSGSPPATVVRRSSRRIRK
jgi:hypothetical protein